MIIFSADFANDLEQQLNVYVDCRAAFSNLDSVLCRLVMCVCTLAMKAHKVFISLLIVLSAPAICMPSPHHLIYMRVYNTYTHLDINVLHLSHPTRPTHRW